MIKLNIYTSPSGFSLVNSLLISDSIFSQSRWEAYGLGFFGSFNDTLGIEAGGGKTTFEPSKVGQLPEFSFLRIIST